MGVFAKIANWIDKVDENQTPLLKSNLESSSEVHKVNSSPEEKLKELQREMGLNNDVRDDPLEQNDIQIQSKRLINKHFTTELENVINQKIAHYLDIELEGEILMYESIKGQETFYFSYHHNMTAVEFDACFNPTKVIGVGKKSLTNLLEDLKLVSIQCDDIAFLPMYGNPYNAGKVIIKGRLRKVGDV